MGPQVDLVLLEKVVLDLELEEMSKALAEERERLGTEQRLLKMKEQEKKENQVEILRKLDEIISAIEAIRANNPRAPPSPIPNLIIPSPDLTLTSSALASLAKLKA